MKLFKTQTLTQAQYEMLLIKTQKQNEKDVPFRPGLVQEA
jgi:hypothetical protein